MPCVAVTVDVAVALVDLGRYSLSKEMEIRISCQINDERVLIRMEVELTGTRCAKAI